MLDILYDSVFSLNYFLSRILSHIFILNVLSFNFISVTQNCDTNIKIFYLISYDHKALHIKISGLGTPGWLSSWVSAFSPGCDPGDP